MDEELERKKKEISDKMDEIFEEFKNLENTQPVDDTMGEKFREELMESILDLTNFLNDIKNKNEINGEE